MKALAINGSPRPGGNTEIMLKKVLEPLEAAGWSDVTGYPPSCLPVGRAPA